jgi:hypothetical protein
MYRIQLTLSDPLMGDSETLTFQFDPATLNQAKWNAAFPTVQGSLTTLVTRATPKEPPTW